MRWQVVALTLALVTNARAEELTAEEAAVQIHGFVSQGALLSSDNNFLAESERGSLEFTEAGIALSKQLDPRLRVGFQLFARDLGPTGNYSAKLDWFNLDYRWRDWLGIRAGRTKLPFGLYNEFVDVDAAYAAVLLPQSVYSITSRDFLLAQTGVELYGYYRLGERAGALDYRAYLGSIYLSIPSTPEVQVVDIDVPYVAGGRLIWETPLDGVRIGGSLLTGQIDGDFIQFGMPVQLLIRQKNVLGSIEYTADSLVFSAEYGRGFSNNKLTVPLMPDANAKAKTTSEFGYLMATYRLTSWLQPAAYYSLHYPNKDKREGPAGRQHDAALSLRFDITPNWILKLEGHHMRGTASLQSTLNDPTSLVNRWYLLAAKTTVYF
jgi:hypothetical protein